MGIKEYTGNNPYDIQPGISGIWSGTITNNITKIKENQNKAKVAYDVTSVQKWEYSRNVTPFGTTEEWRSNTEISTKANAMATKKINRKPNYQQIGLRLTPSTFSQNIIYNSISYYIKCVIHKYHNGDHKIQYIPNVNVY